MHDAAALEMPRTENSPGRLTAWDYFFRALALLSLLLFVALAWDLLAHPDAPTFSTPPSPLWFHTVFGFVISPLWWIISALILWRAPGNLVGRFLLLMMIGGLGWQFTFGIGSPQFGSVVFELFIFYWGAIGFPSLVFLLMVFPDGKLFPPLWRPWVFLFATVKVVGTILELMSIPSGARIFSPTLVFNPFFVPAMAQYQKAFSATIGSVGPFILIGVSMGIASLVLRYRVASEQVRQQIKWLLWWAVVFVLLMPLYYVIILGIPVGNTQFSTLFPLLVYFNLGALLITAIGIAILRYHLFDIDLILNRTLVYGALTAFVIGGYGLIVGYLSTIFRSDNLLFSLVATGIVAILFQPLREWLQRAVNRLLYGERDDPYAILSQLGQRLETALAPDAIPLAICETVARALKLPYVGIEMTAEDGRRTTEAHFPSSVIGRSSPVVRLPLVYQHETLGELVIAPRSAAESLTPNERRLLTDIARQAGIAAHAVRLTADLQRSRERLVTAREEERRRLRRDLHDGLGPQLASQTLTLTAARQLLRQNPDEADALLVEAIKHAQDAFTDIRRLTYDLRPPALDDLGLAAALRAQAEAYETSGVYFTVAMPAEGLLPLPAAVEAACYRIAQEALTNVVKHANAHHCTLTLTLDGALRLEISDDGRGLPAERRAGVGLNSMRERAEELGGQCVIESAPTGGTRVMARLPIT